MSYEIELPNGDVVEVHDSVPPDVARRNLARQFPDLFPKRGKKQGFVPAMSAGFDRGVGSMETFGADIAEKVGLDGVASTLRARSEKNNQAADKRFEPTTQEDTDAAFEKKGMLSGIGSLARQHVTEPAGGMVGALAPALGGAVVGAASPIPGGAEIGFAAPFFAQAAGQNQERQREVNPGQDPDLTSSMATAILQTGVNLFGFGKMINGALGSQLAMREASKLAPKVLSGEMTKEAAAATLGGTLRNVSAETGASVAINAGTGVIDEAARRAQAGQSLTDDKAQAAYKDIAKTAAVFGPAFGAVHGAGAKGRAQGHLERAEQQGVGERSDIAREQQEGVLESLQADAAAEAAANPPVVVDPNAQKKALKQSIADGARRAVEARDNAGVLDPNHPLQMIPGDPAARANAEAAFSSAALQPDMFGQDKLIDPNAPREHVQRAGEKPFELDGGDQMALPLDAPAERRAAPEAVENPDQSMLPYQSAVDVHPPFELEPAPAGGPPRALTRESDFGPEPQISVKEAFSGLVYESSPTWKKGMLDGHDLTTLDGVQKLQSTLKNYVKNLIDNEKNAPRIAELNARIETLESMKLQLKEQPELDLKAKGVKNAKQPVVPDNPVPSHDPAVVEDIHPGGKNEPKSSDQPVSGTGIENLEVRGGAHGVSEGLPAADGHTDGAAGGVAGSGTPGEVAGDAALKPESAFSDDEIMAFKGLPQTLDGIKKEIALAEAKADKAFDAYEKSYDDSTDAYDPQAKEAYKAASKELAGLNAKKYEMEKNAAPSSTFVPAEVKANWEEYGLSDKETLQAEDYWNNGFDDKDFAKTWNTIPSDKVMKAVEHKYSGDQDTTKINPHVAESAEGVPYTALDIAKHKGTFAEVMDHISMNSDNKMDAMIATAMSHGKDTDPTIVVSKLPGKERGMYDPKTHTIHLDETRADNYVLLHESVHAKTSWAFNPGAKLSPRQRQAVQNIRALYTQVKDAGLKGYGIKNVKEFVAEAFTNPDFQLKLSEMPGTGRSTSKYQSLWNHFVAGVKKILGLKDDTALEEVITGGVQLFDGQVYQGGKLVTTTKAFIKWFGESKVVNADGDPAVYYHGTSQDIKHFKAKQAGAIFASPSPKFSGGFANMSKHWMETNYKQVLSPDQVAEVEALKASGAQPYDVSQMILGMLPSGPNIIAVYVKADKPFDFQNKQHVQMVADEVKNGGHFFNREGVESGDWVAIESPATAAAIRKLGFDGMYMMESGVKNIAVFDPTQVKSVYGNKGTFNPKDPLIDHAPIGDYSDFEVPKAAPGVVQKSRDAIKKTSAHSLWDTVRQEVFDINHGAARLFADKAMTRKEGGVLKATARALLQYANYGPQLAGESLAVGKVVLNKEGFPKVEKDASNMKALLEAVDAINTPGDKLHKFNGIQANLAYWEREQLLGQKQANAVKLQNQARIDMKAAKKLTGTAAAKAISKAKAQLAMAEDLLNKDYARPQGVNDVNIRQALADAQDPAVKKALDIARDVNMQNIDFVEATGLISKDTADLWRKNKFYVPLNRVMDEALFDDGSHGPSGSAYKFKEFTGSVRNVDDITQNMMQQRLILTTAAMRNQANAKTLAELMADPTNRAGVTQYTHRPQNVPNIITVKEAGEKVFYRVDDQMAYKTLRGLNDTHHGIVNMMEYATRFLRDAVMLSPDAIVRNLVRDTQEAWAFGDPKKPFVLTAAQIGKQVAKSLPGVVREGFSDRAHQPHYEVQSFGITGQKEHTSLTAEHKAMMRQYAKAVGAKDWAEGADKAIDTAMRIFKPLHNLSIEGELAPRNQIFKDTLKRTGSETEAAMAAINTLDFRQRGANDAIGVAKKLIPFFNSSLQGMYKIIRVLKDKDNPVYNTASARRAFIAQAAKMMLVATAYQAYMSDDEDYMKVPKEIRDRNILVPIGNDESGQKLFLKVSLPFEFGTAAWTTPANILDLLNGHQNARETLSALAVAYSQAVPGVSVQAVKPLLENVTNHSFYTGKQLESDTMQRLDKTQRKYSSTSDTAAWIGESIGQSPIMVENFLKGYTGTLGMLAVQMADSLFGEGDKASTPGHRAPVLKSMITNPEQSMHRDRFYDLHDKVGKAYATAKKLHDEGKQDEMMAFLERDTGGISNRTLIAVRAPVTALNNRLMEASKMEKAIQASKLSPDEKQARLTHIRRVVNAQIEKALPGLRKAAGQEE